MALPLRVLVVEDREDDVLLVTRELQRGGFDVSWERVETREAMAEALDRGPWDLILSDFRMPRFSAAEALALYRERGIETPFILVSGTVGEEQAVESLKAGAHDFFLKSRLTRLCPAVERELREAANRRARRRAEEERAWLHDVVTRSLNEVYVFDPETLRFRFANLGACRNSGYTQEELAGLTPLDIRPEFTAETFRAMLEPLRTTGRPVHVFETVHRRKDGSEYPAEAHLQLVEAGAGAVFLCVVNDITERRRAETRIRHLNRVYAVLSEVNQAIVRVREPEALFAEACRIAVETGGFRMAWVGLLDAKANSVRPVAHAGVTDGYLDKLQIGFGDGPRGLGPAASALREGRHDVCNDIEHDPHMAAWRDDALARGYRASAAFPLTVNGETLGTFTLYASEPGFFDAGELRLLDEMATDLSFAMEMARLEDVGLRLATAIEQAPVSVMITDADGRIEYVNPAFTRMTGYAPEEALGGNPRMLKSGKQEPALYQELWATISAGKSWHGELVNRRKDGSLCTQELTIAPIRDAAGRVTHFVGIGQDVTERKKDEHALRLARFSLDQAADMILWVNHEGQHVYVNNTALRLLGYSREELLGMSVWDVTAGLSREKWPAAWEAARHEGSVALEETSRRKDGSTFPIEVVVTHVAFGETELQCAIIRDISVRRRMAEALRQREAQLAAIYDGIAEPIYLLAVEPEDCFRFLSINHAFLAATGLTEDQVVGKRIEEVLPESSRALVIGKYRQAIRERRPVDWEEVAVFPAGRRVGEVTVSPLWDDRGSCTHLVGWVRDVTDARRLEEEREHLETQLRQSQKLEAIGSLAGGVAHDFNNILGVIMGYGELAQRQLGPGHPVRARVDQMVKAAERAAGLTRQLLAFSRKQVMQPKLLDLDSIVANTQKMLGRLIGEDLELVIHATAGLGTVNADPGQIEQIILNLAVNARDAMPKGGRLTLETANVDLDEDYAAAHPSVQPGRYVLLAVSDTGIGMDEETQQRIFEPFFTTKPEGEGTGLGLATVYGIVKQSGGHIWVYSEPGRGTTFKVYLPRVDELAEAAPAGAAPAEAPRGHETILLVEDTETLRDVIRETLEERGYTVLLASNGEEALALARKREGPIDLLLTDVVMPKLGGGELAKLLLALRPGIRVLYMSGYTNGAISQHGVLGEGVALLEKPFTGDKLARAVREALDRPAPRG